MSNKARVRPCKSCVDVVTDTLLEDGPHYELYPNYGVPIRKFMVYLFLVCAFVVRVIAALLVLRRTGRKTSMQNEIRAS